MTSKKSHYNVQYQAMKNNIQNMQDKMFQSSLTLKDYNYAMIYNKPNGWETMGYGFGGKTYVMLRRENMKAARKRLPWRLKPLKMKAMNGDVNAIADVISHYQFGNFANGMDMTDIFHSLGWLFFARLLGVEEDVYDRFVDANFPDYEPGETNPFATYMAEHEALGESDGMMKRAREFGANLMKAYSSGETNRLPRF